MVLLTPQFWKVSISIAIKQAGDFVGRALSVDEDLESTDPAFSKSKIEIGNEVPRKSSLIVSCFVTIYFHYHVWTHFAFVGFRGLYCQGWPQLWDFVVSHPYLKGQERSLMFWGRTKSLTLQWSITPNMFSSEKILSHLHLQSMYVLNRDFLYFGLQHFTSNLYKPK